MSPFTKVKMSPYDEDKKVDKLHIISEKEIKRLQMMSQLEKKRTTQVYGSTATGAERQAGKTVVACLQRTWSRRPGEQEPWQTQP